MITLGINAAFHDSAAAIAAEGVTLAAVEEERFSRIKHAKRPVPFSAWELPYNAIDYCLREAGISLSGVDHVAYSFDPACFPGAPPADAQTISLPLKPAAGPSEDWSNPWDALFTAYVRNAPRQLIDGVPHHLRRRFVASRRKTDKGNAPGFKWHFVNHHTCHQASAFLAAPFERCAVLTLDGRGERATTTYGAYRDSTYEPFGEVTVPNSLGILYERITEHLGFLQSSDEYKVMALAALGEPRYRQPLSDVVRVGRDGQFTVAPLDMEVVFGPARTPGQRLEQRHFDIAASLQSVLEDTVLRLARWLREKSGEPNLAMAGGVALNCVMNARLRDARIFDNVWVQPAAGDAGTALGAALWVDARERAGREFPISAGQMNTADAPLAPRLWRMNHAYLGPSFSDEEIESQLRWAKLPYRRLDDVGGETARLLAENAIIGWFQGRMEYGPRALGARSILASPIDPEMQARMNELKDREDFRPVAPAIPREDLAQWFTPAAANGGDSPFMLFIYDALPGQGKRIPSACHTDHTARVQTVHEESNPRFHALLRAFGDITGVPVLINTSFNVRGQPIVCTPRDAIEAFASTPLDALVIGSFMLRKTP
ncbi:carbamoyltransferase [Propionivibrio soli]|uniref:carbamoyltransferase family protein n=1 Tax=Propionivibrio soli TaxID=2976531 RepID=UPI0021E99A17|nr:carbamoyltransferase C-terminal domain-containing protein [Propionivibrio soli]